MEDYSAKDFKALFFNVYDMHVKDKLFEKFPILQSYPAFRAELPNTLSRTKVFRYIGFAFDRNTPLKNLNDVMKIRNYAAQLAGFKVYSNGKFDHQVENMLYSKNEKVNAMIIQFCIITEGDDYATLLSFTEALRKENLKLLNSEESSTTSNAIKNINALRKEVNALRKTLIRADKDTLLEKSLYNFAEAEDLGLSPEAYAEKLEASKNTV